MHTAPSLVSTIDNALLMTQEWKQNNGLQLESDRVLYVGKDKVKVPHIVLEVSIKRQILFNTIYYISFFLYSIRLIYD